MAACAHAETLQDALAIAYQNNPEIQSERAKLRSVDEQVPEALSNWRPSVTAQTDAGVSRQVYDNTSGDLKPVDASASLSQPLYRGGRTVASTKEAEETVFQERSQLTITEQTVFVNAATAYLDLLQDQAIVDLQNENLKTLNSWVGEANERFKHGEQTRTDVSLARSRRERARADLTQADVNLRLARSAYARFFGEPEGKLEPVKLAASLPDTEDGAVDAALRYAPEVQAAEHNERAGKADIAVNRGALRPEVALLGTASTARNENVPEQFIDQNNTANDQLVVQLKVPLYMGGGDYARLAAAHQVHAERRHDLDEARREAAERVTQAWEQLAATESTIAARKDEVIAAKDALRGMVKEERIGDRSSTDTLDAEQDLLSAQVAQVQAAHDHTVAFIQLLAAMGRFTAEDLKLKVALYDPEEHYQKSRRSWLGTDSSEQ